MDITSTYIKKLIFFLISIILLLSSPVHAQVSVEGRKILSNGNVYQIRGVCYSPHSIGAQQYEPDYSKVNQDIQLMKLSGVNTIRTYHPVNDKFVLDAFAGAGIKIIIGFTYKDITDGTLKHYVNTYKSHPAILFWLLGNNYNVNSQEAGGSVSEWYTVLENAANLIHSMDPSHPVATAHNEVPDLSALSACPNVDIWGINTYRSDPGTLFVEWAARSTKPMFLSEAGVDSYPSTTEQANTITRIWKTVNNNGTWQNSNTVCSGVTFSGWVDEWWKAGSPSIQNAEGFVNSQIVPDSYANVEYFGIVDIYRKPKPAYTSLKNAFRNSVSNFLPSVNLTAPVTNANYTAPANIVITAKASDVDGTIARVEFYSGSVKVGEDISAPYSYKWNNVPPGNYNISVKAIDNLGGETVSAPVNVSVSSPSTPFNGTPAKIPGRVQAEKFDIGGPNIAYYDKTPNNEGKYFRQEGVDIGEINSNEGYAVGWIAAGEWLKYSIDVAASKKYDFKLRLSSIYTGKTLHIEIDGVNVTGTVNIPSTESWNNWTIVTVPNISLSEGKHIMRVVMDSEGFYIDHIDISPSNVGPVVTMTSPSGYSSYAAGSTVVLAATATDADGSISKVEFFQNNIKVGEDLNAPYSFTLSNVPAGVYSIYARATDNNGAVTTSSTVSLIVNTVSTAGNLALNKPAYCSSHGGASYNAGFAVDGSLSTRWGSSYSDPQWLYVDLGSTYNINRVKVTWETALGKDYKVQVSSDATNWTEIKSVSGNTNLVNDLTGLSGKGRYVRIYGTSRGTSYGYSIFELEVYGYASARLATESGTMKPSLHQTSIYPNPITDLLSLKLNAEFDMEVKLELADVLGKTVIATAIREGETNYQLYVGDLNEGVYFVHLTAGKENITRKILIDK